MNGFADVFEATVNIVVRDKTVTYSWRPFTTATCGSGCWGDFSEAVAFEIDERQSGCIEVAEDGSEQNVVSIPVTPRFPERGPRLGQVRYPEQPPLSWDALQRVTAAILEADAGSHHQITQRA